MKASLEKEVGKKNPAFLERTSKHLWAKPVVKVLGKVETTKKKITDIDEAKTKMQNEMKNKEKTDILLWAWITRHVSDEIDDKLFE